jgi:hypothetical protein
VNAGDFIVCSFLLKTGPGANTAYMHFKWKKNWKHWSTVQDEQSTVQAKVQICAMMSRVTRVFHLSQPSLSNRWDTTAPNYTLLKPSYFFLLSRWFLDAPFQYSKTSPTYIAIGLALTISYILTRIVTIPFYYYSVYMECSTYMCTPVMLFLIVSPCLVLDGLSLWWLRRIICGFKKIIYEGWFKKIVLEKYMYMNGNAKQLD